MAYNTPSDVHVPGPVGGEGKKRHSREYLEAFHATARKQLPKWQSKLIHDSALPQAGGAANRRTPQHTTIESALLQKLTPAHLLDLTDDQIKKAWIEISEFHRLAMKKGLDLDAYERAASFCAQEMNRRGLEFDESNTLGRAALQKSKLSERLNMIPDEISFVGAAALSMGEEGLELHCMHSKANDAILCILQETGIPLAGVSSMEESTPEKLVPVYDLVLRKSGIPAESEPIFLSTLPQGREPLAKAAITEKRLIWYVAAEPGMPDTYEHIITADEVEDACHRFALGPRRVFMEHGEIRGINEDGRFPPDVTGQALIVESGLAPAELATFFGKPVERPIPMGSWIVCMHVPDMKLWDRLRDLSHGISWRGPAVKVIR